MGRDFFDDLESMVDRAFDRRLVSDFFSTPTSVRTFPMDLIEQPDAYIIRADAPGLDKSDIKIEVSGNRLTLSGERKEEKKDNEGGFTRYERTQSSFCRAVQLPRDAETAKIDAKLDKGVLSLSIPRRKGEPNGDVKRIEIK